MKNNTILKSILALAFSFIIQFSFGQEEQIDSTKLKPKETILKDTIILDSLQQKEIITEIDTLETITEVRYVSYPKFKIPKEKRDYLRLQIRVYKTYVYAKQTAKVYLETKEELAHLDAKSSQRKYIKEKQLRLMAKYEERLRKMSKKDGKVLCKLIHREAGIPAYSLIKEMRSSWSAFWWNAKANMFDISLKMKYNPKEIQEDAWIENILQRSYAKDLLKPLDKKTIQKLQVDNPSYKYLNLSEE